MPEVKSYFNKFDRGVYFLGRAAYFIKGDDGSKIGLKDDIASEENLIEILVNAVDLWRNLGKALRSNGISLDRISSN